MKCSPLAVLILLSVSLKAQRFQMDRKTGVAAGISGGYSSKNCTIGNLSLGWMFKKQNHVSINLQVLGKIDAADIPVIGEARFGHSFGAVELYGGLGYHYASSDGEKFINDYVNGWKPGYGIIFKFPQTPFTVSAAMSGKIFSIQAGIFGVR
jgi:hypothetical protein